MPHYFHHKDRGILEIKGPDAFDFLQGLITNDMVALNQETCLYAALLTPQGKLLFDFFIYQHNEDINDTVYYLDCLKAQLDDLTKRLMMYRLRSKVDITDKTDELLVVSRRKAIEGTLCGGKDPRDTDLGWRGIIDRAAAKDLPKSDLHIYNIERIKAAAPNGVVDMGDGKTLILEGNFDHLNGVSFQKGCYVGQENTARMHHRNKINRRLVAVEFMGKTPEPGTQLFADGIKIGEMRSSCENWGLAHLKMDNIQNRMTITSSDDAMGILTLTDWQMKLTQASSE